MIETLEQALEKSVRCTDGQYRRLDRIEVRLLHYSVPIGSEGRWRWMELGGTRRWEAEPLFIGGEVEEPDA